MKIVFRLKHKRQNVDSGYSTSSDGFDKRWSQEIEDKSWTSRSEVNGSILSTPSTESPAPPEGGEGDEGDICIPKGDDYRLSPCEGYANYNGNNEMEEKTNKPLNQIQTYK